VASGLYRQTKEVWLTTGAEAGILDGWIADKGALAEGAGPYPLLDSGFTDVFRGLPFGKTLRGDAVRVPVIGRNSICGGIPEQGKSSAARIVAAGYTLDITTELRIYVPDLNFDFQAFEPRCSRFVVGAEDEYIRQIRDELAELEEEIQRRGQLLIDCGQPEVTAEVAAKVPGLHPLFVLLEEAHVAIQHETYGKAISQSLVNVVKLDRKRGIHLMVSTQAPTKDSMPRDVTRNCSNGMAFAVGDHVANDALLGQGAYAGGHRATDLIPGADQGTALCKGFSGQRSELVQVHFLSVKRDNDQVSPIVKRALDAMAAEGRAVPGTDRARVIEQRDLLADLDAVLSRDKTRLADIPALLKRLAPAWPAYKSLNGVRLAALLDEAGVRWTNPGNVPTIDPADLRKVLSSHE
jgi:S-DNA-T family DNA segregation ATPase FtsK/SpoIIIE